MKALMILAVAIVMTTSWSSVVSAVTGNTDKQADKIESVLDKLESRYLDRESGPLTYEEQNKAAANDKKPAEIMEIKPKSPIQAETPNGRILKDIQGKITEYDNQLDSLEADARKLKAGLIEGSTIDNQVTVDVRLKNPKTASMRTLTAKIDGSTLFNQNDPAGMWIPAKSIAIYQGPMQPGAHRLEVTAVVTRTNADGLALSGWNQQQVIQSFTFDVPEGKVRKTVAVEIEVGNAKDEKATAKLDETQQVEPTVEPTKSKEKEQEKEDK